MEKAREDNTSESQVSSPKPLKTYDFCPTSEEYQLIDKQRMDKLRNHVEKFERQLKSALVGQGSESKHMMITESEVTTLLDSMIDDLSDSKREDEKRINDVTNENRGHSFNDEMTTLHLKAKETKCCLAEAEISAYLKSPPSMKQSELNEVDSLLLELTRFNDLMNILSDKNGTVSSLKTMSTLYVQRLKKVNSIRAFRTMSRKEERETTSACEILATIVSSPIGRNHVVGKVCLANLIHSLKAFMKEELLSDACNQSKRLVHTFQAISPIRSSLFEHTPFVDTFQFDLFKSWTEHDIKARWSN